MNYVRCIHNSGNEASLTKGAIYRTLGTTRIEEISGMLRIIDNEGEDYLYPDHWFEMMADQDKMGSMSQLLTTQANTVG